MQIVPEISRHSRRAWLKVGSARSLSLQFCDTLARPGQADRCWCVYEVGEAVGGRVRRREEEEEEKVKEQEREAGGRGDGKGCKPRRRSARSLLQPRTRLTGTVCVCVRVW